LIREEGKQMTIEDETKKDLALGDQDAESVVGGRAVKTSHRTKVLTLPRAGGPSVSLIPSTTEPFPGVAGADEVDIEC
jgi:hypothetical protein